MNSLRRRELKFYIPLRQVDYATDYLRATMLEDRNSITSAYTISSLYFDSLHDDDLREKLDGIMFREKYRVRVYNFDTSYGKFEIKRKLNNTIEKISKPLNPDQMQQVLSGNIRDVLEQDLQTEYVAAKLNYKYYTPKSIVTYERKAYYLPVDNIRVTLDQNLRSHGFNTNLAFINDKHAIKILPPDHQILEVKFSGELPEFLKRFLTELKLVNTSISKYALSRADSNTEIYGDDPLVPF